MKVMNYAQTRKFYISKAMDYAKEFLTGFELVNGELEEILKKQIHPNIRIREERLNNNDDVMSSGIKYHFDFVV